MENYKKADDGTLQPRCMKYDCFAINDGFCAVLVDNDFGGRVCPFYKSAAQIAAEREATEKILAGKFGDGGAG